MDRTLGLFPGLAAAAPGMGRRWRAHRDSRQALESLSTVAGIDVEHLVCDAGPEQLFRDRDWEIGTVACEIAAGAALRTEGDAFAALPFSIGAYAALWWAGVLDLQAIVTMIDVVLDGCRRLPGQYSMVAVTGVASGSVRDACAGADASLSATITPMQHIVAGDRRSVEKVVSELSPRAIAVRTIPVRWPLHTRFMTPVAEELNRARSGIRLLGAPRKPIVSPIDGALIEDEKRAWQLLTDHLTSPLDLGRAFHGARALGFSRVVEVGPGNTLTRAAQWWERDASESGTRVQEC